MNAGDILRYNSDTEELELGEGFYQIPSLVHLEKTHKSKQKNNPLLMYMFHILHPNSILDSLELSERIKAARQLLDLTKEDCEHPDLLKALADYDTILSADLALKMMRSVTNGVTRLTEYFDNVDFNKTIQSGPQLGKLLHDPKTLISAVKDSREALQQVEALRKDVLESLKVKKEVESRGGVDTGNFNRYGR